MQQINLYLPEFQPNREFMRSVHMLWGLGIFVFLLTLVSVFSASVNSERERALAESRANLEQLILRVAELEGQRPRINLAELDAELLKQSQELERRQQILTIIANKNLGNNTGFSAHLQALGRQSLPTLSLSVFSLQYGGNYVEFAGKTQAADQVPLYIQKLRTEAVFANSAFGVLNLEPEKNSRGIFSFSLAKQAADMTNKTETKTAVQAMLELNQKAGEEN